MEKLWYEEEDVSDRINHAEESDIQSFILGLIRVNPSKNGTAAKIP